MAKWADDDPEAAMRGLTAEVRAALPVALEQARAPLAAATMADFKRTVVPSLALVAPVGMTEEDRTTWLVAAMDTLSGIPADLLERGCREARKKVDHPSKIVAAIFAEVQDAWDRRKRALSDMLQLQRLADGSAPRAPWEQADDFDPAVRCTPQQAAAARAEHGITIDAPSVKPPAATVADYIELGLTPQQAAQAVSDHRRMWDRGSASQVGAAAAPAMTVADYRREHCVDPANPTPAELAAMKDAVLAKGRRQWTQAAAPAPEPITTEADAEEPALRRAAGM